MTEQNLGTSESSAAVQTEGQAPQVGQSVEGRSETPQKVKGYVPDQEVNDLVKGAKEEGYKKAQREAEMLRETEALKNVQNVSQANPGSQDALLEEKTQRAVQAAIERKVAENALISFRNKVLAGSEKHPDFDDVVGPLNVLQHPSLIAISNSMDNTADVLYELGQNPSKFASVIALAREAPELAHKEMTKLSISIKKNQESLAQNAAKAQEPLDQMKPSTTSADSGSMTVDDFRNQDWLRG